MTVKNPALATAWTRNFTQEVSKPIFLQIPSAIRPYALAVMIFLSSIGLMLAGQDTLLRHGIPWAMLSLIVIAITAVLFGAGPSFLVLVLSVILDTVIVPTVPPPHPVNQQTFTTMLLVRTILLFVCGAGIVLLGSRTRTLQEKFRRKYEVVKVLQSMILPSAFAEAPGYDLCAIHRPASEEDGVGGDFYDFFPNGPGIFGILSGDIVGRGREAAPCIALLRYSARALLSAGMNPALVINEIKAMIENQQVELGTATLFVGNFDVDSGILTYANAGHEPPMLKRNDGTEEVLEATGPLLAAPEWLHYDGEEVYIGLHDSLLLLTDGVSEARDSDGSFMYGDHLWRLFRSALDGSSAHETVQLLDAGISKHIGTNQRDDITMLLLRGTQYLAGEHLLND